MNTYDILTYVVDNLDLQISGGALMWRPIGARDWCSVIDFSGNDTALDVLIAQSGIPSSQAQWRLVMQFLVLHGADR
jgi:hypothetical protein